MALTTTTVAMGAILAGAAVSAAGAAAQGQAAKGQADFQAAVQQQQAIREREIAQQHETDFRRQHSALLARRRAIGGASGVDFSTGSQLLATEDFVREMELQAQRIRAGGEATATRMQQQAALTRAGGQGAQDASFLHAGSSLLTGAGRAFGG